MAALLPPGRETAAAPLTGRGKNEGGNGMSKIRVVVNGASGKMGQTVIAALSSEPDIEIVGAVDIKTSSSTYSLSDGRTVPMSPDVSMVLAACKPDVVVDFSTAKAIMPLAHAVFEKGARLVTTVRPLSLQISP
jgi:dihydrodipicolinate reductase